MKEYWENKFREINLMWGMEPAESALYALDFFQSQNIRKILIPGIGYGRNASVFYKNGFDITGIEISGYAIEMARQSLGLPFTIHHGSVNDMPFDNETYNGIFCYALLHLLNKQERIQFIRNCFNQLNTGGYLIFSVVSKSSSMYGQGNLLSKNRYEIMKGLNVFYYDLESARSEFLKYGLVETFELDEPIKFMENEPPMKMILIKCKNTTDKKTFG